MTEAEVTDSMRLDAMERRIREAREQSAHAPSEGMVYAIILPPHTSLRRLLTRAVLDFERRKPEPSFALVFAPNGRAS